MNPPGTIPWMAEVCRAAHDTLLVNGIRNDQLPKVANWIASLSQPPAPAPDAWQRAVQAAKAAELFEDGVEADLASNGITSIAAAFAEGRRTAIEEIELDAGAPAPRTDVAPLMDRLIGTPAYPDARTDPFNALFRRGADAIRARATQAVPDAEAFRLRMGELTTEQVQIAQAAYRMGLSDADRGEADATFAEWLATEMPAGTVIGDPAWWADRIARQYAKRATPQQLAAALTDEALSRFGAHTELLQAGPVSLAGAHAAVDQAIKLLRGAGSGYRADTPVADADEGEPLETTIETAIANARRARDAGGRPLFGLTLGTLEAIAARLAGIDDAALLAYLDRGASYAYTLDHEAVVMRVKDIPGALSRFLKTTAPIRAEQPGAKP